MLQFRNFLYNKIISKIIISLLILNCLTAYGSIIRQKREAPVEAPAAAPAEAAKAATGAPPAPPAPPAAPPCPVSGPMNSAASQVTGAAQPFMGHLDKLSSEGSQFMKDGITMFGDAFNPLAWLT